MLNFSHWCVLQCFLRNTFCNLEPGFIRHVSCAPESQCAKPTRLSVTDDSLLPSSAHGPDAIFERTLITTATNGKVVTACSTQAFTQGNTILLGQSPFPKPKQVLDSNLSTGFDLSTINLHRRPKLCTTF